MSLDGLLHLPPEFDLEPGHWNYERCMYALCTSNLNILRERQSSKDSHYLLMRMSEREREIEGIFANSVDTMHDFSLCHTFKDRGQHWIFKLHKSYIASELCRPAISPGAPKNNELCRRMRQTCIDNLIATVDAWINLYRVSGMTNRSWPAMHRALSCALLLGILKEVDRDPAIRSLLLEFLHALEEVTAGVSETEIMPPLQRSIMWLRKLSQSSPLSTSSSPAIPSLGSEDSPYALMDRMMWPSGTTP
jgi:hypothetical protein